WQATKEVLAHFASSVDEARVKYASFVKDGISAGYRPQFSGGGLVRSAGGWDAVVAAHRAGDFLKSDERILGDSDFVDAVLSAASEPVEDNGPLQGASLEQVVHRVAEQLQMTSAEVMQRGKSHSTVIARSLLCYWGIRQAGLTATELS